MLEFIEQNPLFLFFVFITIGYAAFVLLSKPGG